MRLFKQSAAAVAALFCATTFAHAATITLNAAPDFIGAGLPGAITAGPPGGLSPTVVGAFSGTLTGAPGYSLISSSSPFLAGVSFTFCVELTEGVVLGANPDYSIVNPTAGYGGWGANAPAISNHIDRLMSLALPTIAAAPNTAALLTDLTALQFSLWEVIYDYNPGYVYNLTGGALQINTGAAVLAQANVWLASAALAAAVPTAHYVVAHDPSHQDLLAVAVPEPAPAALLALGLLGLGWLRLARQRAASA
jgi:hypothetical protein